MGKIRDAVKKAVTKPKVVVEESKESVSDVCSNCENSGRECNTCGAGKDVV